MTKQRDLLVPGPGNSLGTIGEVAAIRDIARKCGVEDGQLTVFQEGIFVRLMDGHGRNLATLPYRQVVQDGRPPVLQLLEDIERRLCLRCGHLAINPPLCLECRTSVQHTLEAFDG